MDNQQATEYELGWIAGIVDGEGWLGFTVFTDPRRINGTQVKCELRIVNTDPEIIAKSEKIFRKMGINPYLRIRMQNGINRPIHECATKNMTNLMKILPTIEPYLVGNKKHRARLIMEFINLRKKNDGLDNPNYTGMGQRKIFPYTERELSLVEQCRALQATGASETTREKRDAVMQKLKQQNSKKTR